MQKKENKEKWCDFGGNWSPGSIKPTIRASITAAVIEHGGCAFGPDDAVLANSGYEDELQLLSLV